ncbi:MAG: hypothetical protein AMJ90_08060 [candidate division Zixibacteria bacterium SM23_73_2]|nr:MAG: hypothetical protein AMJ90_08060 [candidate division Zixibacteria bacterium SM23_73_2]
MRINSYIKKGVVVLEPSGKVLPGPDVESLDEKLFALLGKEKKKVIINLGKTDWIGSPAISVLLYHHSRFREKGGELKLANLTQHIREIIVITKLTLVFDVYDSLNEALESFVENLPTQKETALKILTSDPSS